MFSCIWLHFKKCFGKYFLMFGGVLESTIENTFSTCCSHFLTFSRLPNNRNTKKHRNTNIPIKYKNTNIFWVRRGAAIARSTAPITIDAKARSQSAWWFPRSRLTLCVIAIGTVLRTISADDFGG